MSLREDLGLPNPEESSLLQDWRPKIISASELANERFPEAVAYIDGLVLEGLGILGGKPKVGKSWWALRAAVSIASGGVAFGNPGRGVVQAKVLYVSLEDSERRLQQRLQQLLAPGEPAPENLYLVTEWPRLDAGGVQLLAEIVERDGYRVVFIDPLGRVRGPRRGRDWYQEDTDALGAIHDLTRAVPGLAILLVHHNRKDDHPADFIDALSGSTGITGVVDHISVLRRGRGEADAVLHFTSRDAPEHETAFQLDGGIWNELGDGALFELTPARQDLLNAIDDLGGTATNKELADHLGKQPPTVLDQLRGLEADGLAHQETKGGPWRRTPNPPNRPNSDHPELGELGPLGQLWEEEE